MKKGTYTYGLLQYRHSQVLGEVLNIGLLVYFPDLKVLRFIFPDKILRLRFAYPNVPEKTIKAYFKYFETRVSKLNAQPEVFADDALSESLERFIDKEFLPSDSSALQFGNYRKGLLYTPDIEVICDQLYNLYFSVFQLHETTARRIDESVLLGNYKKLLKQFSNDELGVLGNKNSFHLDYEIAPPEKSKLRFDIAWNSSSNLHLVKPISFDLQKSESIDRKAYQYYGRFIDLQDYAGKSDYIFDVILAKPKHKPLFKAYDNAIRLLQQPKFVQLIEPDKLEDYTHQTVEALLST
ncbi:DUF3037 domain-containing protein [Hufsiella ginkgonis]|uniref:DUF3037 domain-containing protein n=1 Tax=Hufsiella ginkgonis TaxID=2695274 RepID=A0A7K1XUA0_9SPHI|nr:DUF3037 domain-containing protein [Hufsiella ginkgonis]MXV14339.1 DUF3037 domain-containing protein [Hufsiella ginkgonis]